MLRLLLMMVVISLPVATARGEDAIDYVQQIQPILTASCHACHGAVEQEGELRVDTAAGMLTGGYSGPAVIAGNSAESPLMERLLEEDHDLRMPLGRAPLTAEQIALIRTWIDTGAVMPEDAPPPDPADHWAFRSPVRPEVPTLPENWGRNPVDGFIAAAHRERGLTPQPEAPAATLLRRVSLDLTGLPPTAAELAAFLNDPAPDAYERAVERMLNSPQYGERWARHWMDVWRYSDWTGYGDEIRESQRHIWRWRDWIVESLNEDKGYDRMVMEMLAADELAPTDEAALRATGYLGRSWYKFNRNVWLDNTVEHLSKGFLGLTYNCAKCHDHMYDPISQADYYSLRAFFEPHQVRTDRLPGEPDLMKDGLPRVYDDAENTPTYLFVRGNEAQPHKDAPLAPTLPEFLCAEGLTIEPIELPGESWQPATRQFVQQEELNRAGATVEVATKELATAREQLDQTATEDAAQVAAAQRQVQLAARKLIAARAERDAIMARSAADSASARQATAEVAPLSRVAAIAQRQAALATAAHAVSLAEQSIATLQAAGEPDEKGVAAATKQLTEAREQLTAATFALEQPLAAHTPLGTVYPRVSTGRRLALARWITAGNNPLTARVAINHIWLRHFNAPLVRSVFDFGRHGTPPTHPELLDWLAVELVDSGWSMKHVHRLMVTSSTYRQASGTDPRNLAADADNLYLWRAPIRRMEAEVVRDSLLQVAGQLDMTLGGPEVDHMAGMTSRRRSLYFRHANERQMEFLRIFDAASVTECYARNESIVPQQGLALFNSPLALAQARLLARQLIEREDIGRGENAEGFVREAFLHVLCRQPTEQELHACANFIEQQTAQLAAPETLTLLVTQDECQVPPAEDPRLRARENLVHVLLNHNDFVTIH